MTVWYEQLRKQYQQERLEVLLIGESPPDSGAGELGTAPPSALLARSRFLGLPWRQRSPITGSTA